MKRVTSLVVMLALAAPLAAQAQGSKPARKAAAPAHRESLHDQFSGQGYGTAGCGLGSIVFGPKAGLIQVVAATTNAYGGQTFAITTGTSNCDIPEMGQQAAMFIEGNRETLTKDAARGQGETVAGLASLLNCDDASVFGAGLQSNYEKIFSTKNSYDTTREILTTIENNPALKASCKIQG